MTELVALCENMAKLICSENHIYTSGANCYCVVLCAVFDCELMESFIYLFKHLVSASHKKLCSADSSILSNRAVDRQQLHNTICIPKQGCDAIWVRFFITFLI